MISATISILWPVDVLKIAVIISLVCQFYGHFLDISYLFVSEENLLIE